MKWIVILLAASMATSAFVDIALSDTLAVPATSKAELKAYLQANPEFPLNRLPPLAKQRFLDSIEYNERGLMALSYTELQQIDALIGYKISEHIKGTEDARIRQATSQVSQTIASKFDVFYYTEAKLPIGAQGRKRQLTEQYKTLFSITPGYLETAENGDLLLLFRAASLLGFYEGNVMAAQNMKQILHELEKRHLVSKSHYEKLYDALLAIRQFDSARTFAIEHDLKRLPKITEAPSLTQAFLLHCLLVPIKTN